jgi:hypothetical protein
LRLFFVTVCFAKKDPHGRTSLRRSFSGVRWPGPNFQQPLRARGFGTAHLYCASFSAQ